MLNIKSIIQFINAILNKTALFRVQHDFYYCKIDFILSLYRKTIVKTIYPCFLYSSELFVEYLIL